MSVCVCVCGLVVIVCRIDLHIIYNDGSDYVVLQEEFILTIRFGAHVHTL